MNEDIYNLKSAGKKKPALAKRPAKPFRLENHVVLASSDKYNDAYTCEIVARKLRERFVISINISCDPVTTRVYSNSWLFNDMATCWDKYHAIMDTVTDVRNFIEAEGLKSVVFQYMVKHALSNIAADVENIYETSNPNARQVIDKTTRGNLIKNFPTMPFRTQSGPDELDEVFGATGVAENPVPEDNIDSVGQLASWQHERRDEGRRDVFPSPISAFQEAAGITMAMFKGAASQSVVKTGEADLPAKQREFIAKVKENASNAIEFGKRQAMQHYMNQTGADEPEAEAFYYGVKAASSQSNVVLNVSATGLVVFMASNEYKPLFESPELLSKFNHYAAKREQAERALGCFGLSPTYASITFLQEGDRGYGKCAMHLADIADDTVLLCGDSFRVRNPARPDFIADPEQILYPFSALQDCKAVSIITSMGKHDLAAGPAVALANILDPTKEFGRCEALIFKSISPKNVAEIVAANEGGSRSIRKILMRIGKLVPVTTSTNEPKIISPAADKEKEIKDDPIIPTTPLKHFAIGDRVATKPMASHFLKPVMGTILDVNNGKITIQWDNQERSIYDLAEALMRVMAAPKKCKTDTQGMVVYSLPGMDDETVLILSASGVDPVSLYSMASHFKPAGGKSNAMEGMIKSMFDLGLNGHIIKGYIPNEKSEDAFAPAEWIEAKLHTGARLIVDLENMTIKAGDIDNYIKPSPQPYIEVE